MRFPRRVRSRRRGQQLTGITQNLMCTCGHRADRHIHYRRGLDCVICGEIQCPDYQPVTNPNGPVTAR